MIETEENINKKLEFLENEIKDIQGFKNKLIDLYLLEFEENFSDILNCDKDKYLDRLGEKISLVISDRYSDLSFERDDFLNLLKKVESIFIHNYYEVSYDFLKSKINNLLIKNLYVDNSKFPPFSRRGSNTSENFNRSNIIYLVSFFGLNIDFFTF